MNKTLLDALFQPQSIAVVGASTKPGKIGYTVTERLIKDGYKGAIYPINPGASELLGLKVYPSVSACPGPVDAAVIVVPAEAVKDALYDCAKKGVKAISLITSGFAEIGEKELEREIVQIAHDNNMCILGPNIVGILSNTAKMNASFCPFLPFPGRAALLSQSGALVIAIDAATYSRRVGFDKLVSLGNMADVDFADCVEWLAQDEDTSCISLYIEGFRDGRRFMEVARKAGKPIIALKAGVSAHGAAAAASHTGSLTGSDEVLHAAFRRTGVLRVDTIAELFHMSEVLAKQPRPQGPRLTIITNAGGPGVLATDMLISSGGELADLSKETFDALNSFLPAAWSHNNPVDVLGDAGADRYARAVEVAAKDPNSDGMLVILTPQAMTDPEGTAEALKPYAKVPGKPLLACWMGADQVEAGEDLLNKSGIPTYKYPDTAARAFVYMWRYTYNLRSLYETPTLIDFNNQGASSGRAKAESIIQSVRSSGRTILTEFESKQLLSAYGIPTVDTRIATTEAQAVKLAGEIGYPVVLKLYSETITHKTDVGGVQLNLRNASAVEKAWRAIESSVTKHAGKEHFQGVTVQPMIKLDGYEIIIGSSVDSQFGPVLLFGSGGQLVEVYKDRALALPPLNATLARRMMEQTKIYTALKGVRGRPPVNLAALEELLVRFSYLVVEQPWISEIDINPLLASPERLIALDARVVVYGKDVKEDKLPKPAIRPYPVQYVSPWKLKNGTPVTIRPIRPEDEPLMVKFHQTLSEQSVYYRYFSQLKLDQRIAHERLIRMCFNDYDREIALVAEHKDPKTGTHEILGVGRLSKARGMNEAEFALIISDKYQRNGLGTELLKRLVQIGRDEKLDRITATILADNHGMHLVSKKVGFKLHRDANNQDFKAVIDL